VAVEVHLVTPDREVWSGTVELVVARGVEGMVGIMGGHAPLLIQLAIGPLRMQDEGGGWQEAVVDGGFLHVSSEGGATRADVLAANAELAAEIDVEASRRRLEELRGRGLDEDDEAAKTEIAKAEARVALVS
jgi:F-type H+-transporting ATPase subunit epsilon